MKEEYLAIRILIQQKTHSSMSYLLAFLPDGLVASFIPFTFVLEINNRVKLMVIPLLIRELQWILSNIGHGVKRTADN